MLDDIFHAYDIRGRVPEELTPDIVRKIGRALALVLNEDCPNLPVVVGHDLRENSMLLSQELVRGLLAQGREVIDIGQVSSDMLYFATGHLEAAGGAMITASHIGQGYNGIKLCRQEARPLGQGTGLEEVKNLVQKNQWPEAQVGGVRDENITDAWIKHALSFIDIVGLKNFQLAVDTGNGMMGLFMPEIERRTNLQITPLFFEPDGSFPNHEANPLKEENLQDLIQTVREEELDFGIAFDGDGDRVFFVDDEGRPVSASVLAALISCGVLEQHSGAPIIYNVICSRIVPETITENGGQPVRTKVGHSFIKAKMREAEAPFGAEHSGHFYFQDNYYADSGLIAALVVMDILSQQDKSLSELTEEFKVYANSGEINFQAEQSRQVIDQIAQQYSQGTQDRLDGLTVEYPDWWFNIRPSNTEPLLRLNIEAENPELLEEKRTQLTNQIQKLMA